MIVINLFVKYFHEFWIYEFTNFFFTKNALFSFNKIYHGMLTIFSISITIYSQQLHLNLIYINMYQDGINYSQIHLYQNTSNMQGMR